MVGMSKPHLLSPGLLHSSWTICIITLWASQTQKDQKSEGERELRCHFQGNDGFLSSWRKNGDSQNTSCKNQLLLFSPVCLTLRQLRQPCSGKNAVDPHVCHSGSPQCWGCVCTEPDPWGQRRRESGHRDHLRTKVRRALIFNHRRIPLSVS